MTFSDEQKKEILDLAKFAFKELQEVTPDKVQVSDKPPIDAANPDAWQCIGETPHRFSVWIKRSVIGSLILNVYFVAKEVRENWTFIKESCEVVRPAIEKMPVAMEEFRYWLRCRHGAAQPHAADGKGKYLAFSPGWHYDTDGQLVDAINQSFNPGIPTSTSSSTTTTTTTTTVNPSGEFKQTDIWLIPQGSGIISDAVYISGVPISVAVSEKVGLGDNPIVNVVKPV